MTLIYAGGVKAAAIANIKTQINDRITAQADGSKLFDAAAFTTWVLAQVDGMLTPGSGEYVDLPSANAQRAITNVNVAPLAQRVSADSWRTHPAWPAAANIGRVDYVAALLQGHSQLKAASAAVATLFDGFNAKVQSIVNDYYVANGVDATVAPGVQRIVEDRFYFYTYVSDWDEESANSPISSMVSLDQNDTVQINLSAPPTGRNIVGMRIYRSNVGNEQAEFQLIPSSLVGPEVIRDEAGGFKYYAASVLQGVDDVKSSQLKETCPSMSWAEPPVKLRGLTGLPNGIMAGFFDSTVCFCESYLPYAWPVSYQISAMSPIVALGSFGNTLVVGTHRGVDFISGADAQSMSQQMDVSLQACAGPRSMVSVEGGVVYASPDGLCLAGNSGVQVITANHFTREDWQKLNPASMVGAFHEMTYYFSYVAGAASGLYALHLPSGKLTTVSLPGSSTLYVDRLSDQMFTAVGASIRSVFTAPTRRAAVWRSKVVVLPHQQGFAWLVVVGDFATPVTVKWYGDGVLRYTAVVTSLAPVRLPPGRYLEHEVEVSSTSRWTRLTLANNTSELQNT